MGLGLGIVKECLAYFLLLLCTVIAGELDGAIILDIR